MFSSNAAWKCGPISDALPEQPSWKTDYSFRLQNICKRGLETWCLLIHERLILISSVHFPEAHLGYGSKPLCCCPYRSPSEQTMRASKAEFCSEWSLIGSFSLSPLTKGQTKKFCLPGILPSYSGVFLWATLLLSDGNKLVHSARTKTLGLSADDIFQILL